MLFHYYHPKENSDKSSLYRNVSTYFAKLLPVADGKRIRSEKEALFTIKLSSVFTIKSLTQARENAKLLSVEQVEPPLSPAGKGQCGS